MLDPATLRGRLTWTYAIALVAALVAFSISVLVVLDRAQRTGMDVQLTTIADAALAIVDVKHGVVSLDADDRRQLQQVAGAKADAAVFAADGALVAATSVAVPTEVRAAAMPTIPRGVQTRSAAGDALRILTVSIVAGPKDVGVIAVWRDSGDIAAVDRRLGLTFALTIPAIAALAILLGGAIARRGLAVLDRIATLAGEIEAHDIGRRLNLPPRGDELGRLAATFDRMLDRLGAAFARERRFTSDASHELRAPLSVIRAEADLALRKDREPAEYRAALAVILEQADDLEHLTRELLAAARAENAAGAVAAASDLDGITRAVGARFERIAADRGVTIEVHDSSDDRRLVRVDSATIERALVPIVHNAIVHAQSVVELRMARNDGFEEVIVCDDGPGFSDEALQRAFDRFWRDDANRSREGSGLGMAIAQAIVVRAAGSIAIGNRDSGGAAVRIRLPRA
jgi:signal transduction histidine kinase